MAWNKPSERANDPGSPQRQNPTVVRGAIAAAIVVGGALVAWFFLAEKEPDTLQESSARSAAIREVKPAALTNHALPSEAPTNDTGKTKSGLKRVKREPSKYGWHNGVYHSPDPDYPESRRRFNEEMAKSPFRYYSEREISAIVCAPPGAFLFPMPIDARFEENFLKSLTEPIIISTDDPPEVAEEKRRVRDAKVYIKQQMDDGVPIAKVISDARDEINKVSRMRDNLARELENLKRNKASKDEVSEYIEAANKMLENAGGIKLAMPWVYRRMKEAKQELEANKEQKK